ncbi:MAG: hypothetical protein DI540_12130 [Sphingobium sp.]|jgi:hypothetical protein|nr:MAG: hypothetical protein DI540_12130 [Sphingobium sp.]|tara:strand:+ start:1626 stop:3938 length:2313 start_codon:yes stop_codon:yes gene_type:complete
MAWEEDCGHFVLGRTGRLGRQILPRPVLGLDLILGLRRITRERRITHDTFKNLASDLTHLFLFLDWLEATSGSGQDPVSSISFDGAVEDLPGAIWGLFEAWLPKQIEGDVLSRVYSQCARVARSAAQEKFGELPGNFILAPNRFPQSKGSNNWDRTDDIDGEDDDYRIIGEALIASLKSATTRIAEGRYLLPDEASSPPKDGVPTAVEHVGGGVNADTDESRERRVIEYGHLWRELDSSHRFAKTAVLRVSPPAFFDRYPNRVIQDDFLSPAPGGRTDLPIVVEYRAKIISAVLQGPLAVGNDGVDASGVPHQALTRDGKALVKAGWIDHIYHHRKNQYYCANDRTKEALERCHIFLDGLKSGRLSMTEQHKLLHLALATKQELQCAFALFLLRTGFNASTALEIVPGNWHRPHPIHGENGTYVDIYAVKNRAAGKIQTAQSSTNKDFTAFDIMRRVIAWTEPLRLMLGKRIHVIEATIRDKSSGLSAQERMALRQTLPRLRDLQNRAWLVVQDDGSIAELAIDWPTLNAALATSGVKRSNGDPVKLSQGMTRRAWAIFAYEKSGANLILTKIALGHSDFASLITYIANQKRRSRHRRDWLDLGGALLRQFQTGQSTAPDIIRSLVSSGRLTEEEGGTLASGTSISAQGMQCSDPTKPDAHIDPSHRHGEMCTVQNCYDGCSRAYPTFDTAIYVAREISRLEQLKSSIDIIAWTESDYGERLEAAEEIFRQYAPKVQADAIKAVKARPPRPMFGTASVGARRLANRGIVA